MSRPRRRPDLRPARARRAGPVRPALLALLALLAAAAGYLVWRHLALAPPSPARLLARSTDATAKLTAASFTLEAPWPQAHAPASGLPGARTLLGPVEGARRWRVLWHRELGMRTELLEPEELRGTLAVQAPGGSWVWSPLLGVALGSPGATPPPYFEELLALARTGAEPRVVGRTTVGGREAWEMRVRTGPAAAGEAGPAPASETAGELQFWFDRATWLPLGVRLLDPNGRALGRVAISDLDLGPAAAAADFDFAPPAGARTLPLGEVRTLASVAQAQLGFVPLQPRHLPAGFALRAVNLLGEGTGAALVLTYSSIPGRDGAGPVAGLISLTQSLAGPDYRPLPYGAPHRVGQWEGRWFELGDLRGLDWRAGEVAMTLFGTVSLGELTRVGASVR